MVNEILGNFQFTIKEVAELSNCNKNRILIWMYQFIVCISNIYSLVVASVYIVLERGVRDVAYKDGDKLVFIPERIPDIIVPDLTDFKV